MRPAILAQMPVFTPADALRADGRTAPVMEVVTFRLSPGMDEAAFLAAARGTEEALARQPGFIARRLLKGEDGWTDLVEWQDLAAAETAAGAMMADPAFAPFLAAIDPESIAMSHPAIRWRMGD